jgi:hypothetical protein
MTRKAGWLEGEATQLEGDVDPWDVFLQPLSSNYKV